MQKLGIRLVVLTYTTFFLCFSAWLFLDLSGHVWNHAGAGAVLPGSSLIALAALSGWFDKLFAS